MHKLIGQDAIEWAQEHGIEMVGKHADPTETERDVPLDEASDICRVDPSLIYLLID